MKKKLGISYSEANFQNYWNWFTAEDLGEEIELVELSFLRNNKDDIEKCDGFVLTGGVDVLPAIYGGAEEYPYKPDEFLPNRDEFERLIYEFSQRAKVPVLGICRGMQYINIMEGGKVFEDNGEQANQLHKKGLEDKIHGVNVDKNSLLYAVTGKAVGQVNSAHHQAVNPGKLGENLIANAYADTPDGLIEGLEFKDKTGKAFMLGVQWHPERMKEKELNPLSQNIKEQFVKEVKNHKR
ncbi:MAG: gamma-glutamyl-gamma-aminobutyrate hydrolase family protein [Candidatus Pedobacter colombiensis]|uniref:Gamma-glutamyl-gamma-aminobutyrate hydrolase family protein n=1 Tax=Candidatus Pedobacter colombiensis TaxID=3121371 RepID=A0AAJ5W6M4_9SPHI|nr:gamma-glutamyl-gamma-aminobutyrate hydrolase family protein [Pedobacter sp.]WEK19508.1 MAG: gamma-glutamyl-gamma-aminobutyrate hydrolase family protein [Pedobacter sp.]